MDEKVTRVEAVRGTSKVTAIRPFGFLDSENYKSLSQKKKMNTPIRKKYQKKENVCYVDENGTHIDYNV